MEIRRVRRVPHTDCIGNFVNDSHKHRLTCGAKVKGRMK